MSRFHNLSDKEMLDRIKRRDEQIMKQQQRERKFVNHDFKYKMLGNLGASHVGSEEWSQKMSLYLKMKAVAHRNE